MYVFFNLKKLKIHRKDRHTVQTEVEEKGEFKIT